MNKMMREMVWKKIEPQLYDIPHVFGKQSVSVKVDIQIGELEE